MDKKLEAGLEAITRSINKSTALAHPDDLEKAVQMLSKLIDAGHVANHVDEVHEYLQNLGMPEDTIREIVLVYETLVRRASPGSPCWKENILDTLGK